MIPSQVCGNKNHKNATKSLSLFFSEAPGKEMQAPTIVASPEGRLIDGDGNCLYASVIDQFDQLKEIGTPIRVRCCVTWKDKDGRKHKKKVRRISIRRLRLLTSHWLEKHTDTPVSALGDLTLRQLYEADADEAISWEGFVQSQRMHSPTPLPIEAWGNLYSLIAIANLFCVHVIIYQNSSDTEFSSHIYSPFQYEGTLLSVHIIYDWHMKHYSSVKLSDGAATSL